MERRSNKRRNASGARKGFVRRMLRRGSKKVSRKHEVASRKATKAFHALRAAQDILDHNRTITVQGNRIGIVDLRGMEHMFTAEQSKLLIREFHEMFDIAKQCTLLCDPLRKKLQELLFICQPIGLSDARIKEGLRDI